MAELDTLAGILHFCDEQQKDMIRIWNQKGRFEANGYSFQGWVLATHMPTGDRADPLNWKPGTKLEGIKPMLCRLPQFVHLISPDGSNTDLFSCFLKHYARATAAVGTIVQGEAWMVTIGGEGENLSKEEVYRRRAEMPKSLGEVPGRTEAMFCSLEHKEFGNYWWTCEIHRNPDRLSDWRRKDLEEKEGLLANLTPVTETISDKAV